MPSATIGQRISRAKTTIREAGLTAPTDRCSPTRHNGATTDSMPPARTCSNSPGRMSRPAAAFALAASLTHSIPEQRYLNAKAARVSR